MTQAAKARVFMNGRSQHVTIPAEFRFSTDEVYVTKDLQDGTLTLSEKAPRPSMAEILKRLDEAGVKDFELERDMSLPIDRDLF